MHNNVARILPLLALLPASTFGQVTFSKDVTPVIFSKCAQCHRPGGSAPFSLLTYREARSHATSDWTRHEESSHASVESRSIRPEVHRIGSAPDSEIDLLQRWAAGGARFEASSRLTPGSAAAHFNYGTALMAAGRLEDAVGQYRRALELRPGYAIAHNNLGTALLRLGRREAAPASFREAARVDPGLDAHLNVGLLSRASGDVPEALARSSRLAEKQRRV